MVGPASAARTSTGSAIHALYTTAAAAIATCLRRVGACVSAARISSAACNDLFLPSTSASILVSAIFATSVRFSAKDSNFSICRRYVANWCATADDAAALDVATAADRSPARGSNPDAYRYCSSASASSLTSAATSAKVILASGSVASDATAFAARRLARSNRACLSTPTVSSLFGSVDANPPGWSNLAYALAPRYSASALYAGHAVAARS